MRNIKPNIKPRYFSVEGETEKWYLEWLSKQINNDPQAKAKTNFIIKVEKDPVSFVKGQVVNEKSMFIHLCDFESTEDCHQQNFLRAIDQMTKAAALGKQVNYKFGYSNLTFELWMILHKMDLKQPLAHRSLYLAPLNKAYAKNFIDLHEYKKEANFKNLLASISLHDVVNAITRAKAIMSENSELHHYREKKYKKYSYFEENPSLMVWIYLEKILEECGII